MSGLTRVRSTGSLGTGSAASFWDLITAKGGSAIAVGGGGSVSSEVQKRWSAGVVAAVVSMLTLATFLLASYQAVWEGLVALWATGVPGYVLSALTALGLSISHHRRGERGSWTQA